MFTKFTGFFQRQEPRIHLLYDELQALALTLIGRVFKPEVMKDKNLFENLNTTAIFQLGNLLPCREVTISDEVKQSLKGISEIDYVEFMVKVQQHYIASCKHLLQKMPLYGVKCITNVARNLPFDTPIQIDALQDEWRLLQLEGSAPTIAVDGNKMRIDHY